LYNIKLGYPTELKPSNTCALNRYKILMSKLDFSETIPIRNGWSNRRRSVSQVDGEIQSKVLNRRPTFYLLKTALKTVFPGEWSYNKREVKRFCAISTLIHDVETTSMRQAYRNLVELLRTILSISTVDLTKHFSLGKNKSLEYQKVI